MPFLYSTLPTNVRSMPLKVTSEEFAAEWRACRRDSQRDLTVLFEMIDPFLREWESVLKGRAKTNINHLTMCRLVHSSIPAATQMVKNWTFYAAQLSSVYEELQLLFLERVRRLKYTPNIATPMMLEYVVAKDFKFRLRHKIVTCQGQKVHEVMYTRDADRQHDCAVEPPEPDYMLLADTGLSGWETYLVKLRTQGLDTQDIEDYIHIPRRKYQEQENIAWLKIETKWRSS